MFRVNISALEFPCNIANIVLPANINKTSIV